MKLRIDDRENKEFCELFLKEFAGKFDTKVCRLNLGDIEILDDKDNVLFLIERKTYSDLYASIKDGRDHEQLDRMVEYRDNLDSLANGSELKNTRVFYLIEGIKNFSGDMISVMSSIANKQIKSSMEIIHTSSMDMSIIYIANIIKAHLEGPEKDRKYSTLKIKKKIKKEGSNMKNSAFLKQLLTVERLSVEKATKIVEKYGKLTTLIDALKKGESISITGIGKKMEQNIGEAFLN